MSNKPGGRGHWTTRDSLGSDLKANEIREVNRFQEIFNTIEISFGIHFSRCIYSRVPPGGGDRVLALKLSLNATSRPVPVTDRRTRRLGFVFARYWAKEIAVGRVNVN